MGSLGDTLVSIPGLQAIRDHFKDDEIYMLTNVPVQGSGASPEEIISGAGLVDHFLYFKGGNIFSILKEIISLRIKKFHHLIYLVRNPVERWKRDKTFFKLLGCKTVSAQGCSNKTHITDQILERLDNSGISLEKDIKSCYRKLYESETFPDYLPENFIGFGIGGKKSLTKWNINNYQELSNLIIQNHPDKKILLLGGTGDFESGEKISNMNSSIINICGKFPVKQSLKVLEKCTVFIGNDTGTIHMAAAVGVRCLGIYSSHDEIGLWHPYGDQHLVLRDDSLECIKCKLTSCPYDNQCLKSITPYNVFNNFQKMINEV